MSFSEAEIERYARHLVLREIGGPGQQRLKGARVLLIGAGGLGSPATLYLAAAGVGTIAIADPDHVSLSNLQRQILFGDADIGAGKAEAAKANLARLNPHVIVETFPMAIDEGNARGLVGDFDLVLDGCDNFPTRFSVSDACVAEGKTLVSGAIGRWTGQIGVFTARPCYRCLVPETPPDAETCSAVGVVGALGGVIGSMMALEAIKLIAGAGEPLTGRMMIYDALAGETRTVRIAADPECPSCRT
ncbi:MAG TPA: HesA/MoeB/ThiF family protein [Caulobacteraceae bacterium]|nr:HesA/MoeB/ThiF family protein [Caulobacteraceae bacterium]